MRRLRRLLYGWASRLGDLEALTSGSPRRILHRVINKRLGRLFGRFFLRR